MVSIETITDKLEQLDEFLDILGGIKRNSIDSFLKDKILIGGAKYYLQVSIECCLDIANHIIAAQGFRAPKDYADSFKVLEEEDLLNDSLGTKLRQMAKFRSILPYFVKFQLVNCVFPMHRSRLQAPSQKIHAQQNPLLQKSGLLAITTGMTVGN